MQKGAQPAAEDARPEAFYVMQEIEGEECLAATRDSLDAALAAMVELAKEVPERDLSVCSTTRGILAFMKDGAPLLVGKGAQT